MSIKSRYNNNHTTHNNNNNLNTTFLIKKNTCTGTRIQNNARTDEGSRAKEGVVRREAGTAA